jgi:hypothetical protein
LTYQDVAQLAAPFSLVVCKELPLLSRLDRVFSGKRIRRALNWVDKLLLDTVPTLRHYARVIVVELTK